jgi:uncharacterized repeat protein (TIGR03843 family)
MSEVGKDVVCDFLATADMEVLGLLPYASNATLLARLSKGDVESLAVYKPRRGERPLWDFPSGTLCLREYAAWLLSEDLGWDLVPPTVLREGPAGFGAVQLFIEEDGDTDVRSLPQTHADELRRMALFDVISNNTDRKAGHLIVDTKGKLWGVDHGICFSDEPKLRTVVWVYESEDIPAELMADVERFARDGAGASYLSELLNAEELDAMCERTSEILRTKRYPAPDPYRRHIPWPPW